MIAPIVNEPSKLRSDINRRAARYLHKQGDAFVVSQLQLGEPAEPRMETYGDPTERKSRSDERFKKYKISMVTSFWSIAAVCVAVVVINSGFVAEEQDTLQQEAAEELPVEKGMEAELESASINKAEEEQVQVRAYLKSSMDRANFCDCFGD